MFLIYNQNAIYYASSLNKLNKAFVFACEAGSMQRYYVNKHEAKFTLLIAHFLLLFCPLH